jgi:spermidine/putrescine transport system substrate-binding protein
MKRKLLTTLLLLGLALGAFAGCRGTFSASQKAKTSDDPSVVLRIANCEEYIDLGDWGADETIELDDGTKIRGVDSMVKDYEKWYQETYGQKVRVEYSTYGTNEDLYNQMTLGNTFDLVCPSEYMIMKLMSEKRLVPLSKDFYEETKYHYYTKGVSPYIRDRLNDLRMGDERVGRYAAGYMWGTLGVVYNPEVVKDEDANHWNMFTNKAYRKRITIKDSIRDSFFGALGILNEKELKELEDKKQDPKEYEKRLDDMMNATDAKTVDQVESILTDMRENAYAMETDAGKQDLVTGKTGACLQWSGDAVFSMDQADEDGVALSYAVPEGASNLWFDGWVMMKDGIRQDKKKQQAAEAFIDFISRPDNVIRNMYYIGYTSCISGGDDPLIYDYLMYNYAAEEDEKDTVDYDVSYFFRDTEGKGNYTFAVPKEQEKRQLFAQYPPEDVLERCVVMKCFDQEANQRISQMWTNIRCYRFPWEK